MALTGCQECGQQISTEAALCPKCGKPQQRASDPPKHSCAYCGSSDLAFSEDKQGFGFGKAALGAVALGPLGLLAGGINRKKRQLFVRCNSCLKIYDASELAKKKGGGGVQVKCGGCGTKYSHTEKTCPSCGRSTHRNNLVGYIVLSVLVVGGIYCFARPSTPDPVPAAQPSVAPAPAPVKAHPRSK